MSFTVVFGLGPSPMLFFRSMKKFILPLFVCIITLLPAEGSTQSLNFEHISIKEGLSQGLINYIFQDRVGFLWFGTANGLNKFDGYAFKRYNHIPGDSTSISDDWVTVVYEDRDGYFWIGTKAGGLNRFDRKTEVFTKFDFSVIPVQAPRIQGALSDVPFMYSYFTNQTITSLYEDQYGMLWIGTFGGGIYMFDIKSSQVTQHLLDVSTVNNVNLNCILTIIEDRNGNLWFGTWGEGLKKFDTRKNVFQHYKNQPGNAKSLSNNYILSIYEDKEGAMWVGTFGGGLNKFDSDTETFKHYRSRRGEGSIGDDRVLKIYEDSRADLWIGTYGGGVSVFDRNTEKFTTHINDPANPNSISGNRVLSIFEDRSGAVWVGTYLGKALNRYVPNKSKFRHFKNDPFDPNSLSDNVVYTILEDRFGDLWIGTFEGGLNQFSRRKGKFKSFKNAPFVQGSISNNQVRSVYEDRAGTIWAGTWGGGLNRFNRSTQSFTHYKHSPDDPSSLSNNHIRSMLEDSNKRFWIATWGGGINELDRSRGKFRAFKHRKADSTSLSDNNTYCFHEDSSGTLWIGTFAGGLNSFDPENEKFKSYQHNPADAGTINGDWVLHITQDLKGRYWVATDHGLNQFDPVSGRFTRYNQQSKLLDSYLYGILVDGANKLWISSNFGILRFDPQSGELLDFDVSDGVQSDEFSGGALGMTKDHEMMFGGVNGFNLFHPDSIKRSKYEPPIVITSFRVSDKEIRNEITHNTEIRLAYDDNSFTIDFAALDFTNPYKNKFKYVLSDLDDNWRETDGNSRFASYNNLQPGTYTFTLIGSNSDEFWNGIPLTVEIIISPPFWQTWPFYIVISGIIAFALITSYRVHVRNKIKSALQLERTRVMESEKIRKKTAVDFHDEFGHKLTKITMFSEIIRRKIEVPEIEYYLQKIIDTAKSLSTGMRDFIWTLDPSHDSLYEVLLNLKDFGDELFDRTGVSFTIKGIDKGYKHIALSMDWRRHVNLIFKEGMNNTLKHAKCENVFLEIGIEGRTLRMTLSDDGIGMDIKKNQRGNGLKNMKSRAQKVGGDVEFISNTINKGTIILFKYEITTIKNTFMKSA